ncbi:MAG: transcriptional regulator, partial [Tepidibacter sp.]|uniref:hypothetical protein n=1 Tax=Tepidibacter sp. TaxID=2529387 RepID=UPI002ED61AAB|nr:transcriptional regulator [Tepidibacter sp.]
SLDRLIDIARGLNTTISYLLDETNENAINFDSKILSNPDFKKILEEFEDFNLWSDEDKKEILAYLRAKSIVRKSK